MLGHGAGPEHVIGRRGRLHPVRVQHTAADLLGPVAGHPVPYRGARADYGFQQQVMGPL